MTVLQLFDVGVVRRTVVAFRDAVKQHAPGLNRLNVYPVPDGDTGTNMARTLDAVVDEMERAPADLEPTCAAISHGSLMGARGNSGVILSQILRGWASTLARVSIDGTASAATVADAFTAASVAAYQAVGRPVEGTILTVAREASEAAQSAAAVGGDLLEVLSAAHAAAVDALARTPDLLPVLREAGVVDAGGAGFVLFLDAALHVLDGRPLPEPDDHEDDGPSLEQLEAIAHRQRADGEVDVSELRYEVMYFLDLDDELIGAFKDGWGAIGDSVVMVGGDGLWNCHIHTNDIGAAIEVPLDLGGRPHEIRVTDLFEEMEEEHAQREAALQNDKDTPPSPAPGAGLPAVTCAVVAVCSGDGLAELFAGLGVQGIVTGGQTLNPSTAELLDAVQHVRADHVVVLPNNKNIVPVAEQLDGLTTKTVRVVPTCSMPEALSALVVYDPEADADTNAGTMAAALQTVATGEVTQAVRDAGTPAGQVRVGDWIGLVRGDGVVAVAATMDDACVALLGTLLHPSHELLTIIEGDGSSPAVTDMLASWIGEHHENVEVEVHRGGQPLYPYLFGAE